MRLSGSTPIPLDGRWKSVIGIRAEHCSYKILSLFKARRVFIAALDISPSAAAAPVVSTLAAQLATATGRSWIFRITGRWTRTSVVLVVGLQFATARVEGILLVFEKLSSVILFCFYPMTDCELSCVRILFIVHCVTLYFFFLNHRYLSAYISTWHEFKRGGIYIIWMESR